MKKYFFSALAIGIAVASVAFTTKADQLWRFDGSTQADITDYTKYTLNGAATGCSAFGNAPCVIVVPEAIDTPVELQSFLANKDASEITELSEDKKTAN